MFGNTDGDLAWFPWVQWHHHAARQTGMREWLGQLQGKQGFLVTLLKPQPTNWYLQWFGIYFLSA